VHVKTEIILSYFVEYPNHLHKTKFTVCECLYFYLFMIKVKTSTDKSFITHINIKFEKISFSSCRPVNCQINAAIDRT